MERSIENIWKTGFETETDLLVPKIARLYKKKSKLIIERLKRSFRIDNAGLPILGLLIMAKTYYDGHLWLGIYLMTLIIGLFFLNRRQFGKLEEVQVTDNLYRYLSSYRAAIRKITRFYIRLVGFGMPLAGIPVIYVFQDQKQPGLWQETIDTSPWIAITLLVLFTIVLSGIGIASYYFSTRIIYGRLLNKLDEMIYDLNQLGSK